MIEFELLCSNLPMLFQTGDFLSKRRNNRKVAVFAARR